jgi:hypothetical protein
MEPPYASTTANHLDYNIAIVRLSNTIAVPILQLQYRYSALKRTIAPVFFLSSVGITVGI